MSLAESSSHQKVKVLKLSLVTACFLTVIKLAAALLTNSVALLSLAVDSLGDILSSLFNYFFLRAAEKPADEDHPYGHGKFENVASFIQGFILIGSAIFVIYRAVQKLIHHEEVYQLEVGMGVIIVSLVASLVVGRKVHKVGKKHGSGLLEVEATHLLMDSYLYIVALGALILSRFGFFIFDPIASLGIAAYILWVSAKILKSSFDVLTDRALSEQESRQVIAIIQDHYPTVLGYDRFQSRQSGSKKLINFRLFMCQRMSLKSAHDVVDHVEQEIMKKISHAEVLIHAEATKEECSKHEHKLDPRHFAEK
ncbi:MAG: cation transporter [Deltaproteobacteria bacterium]|nr:cation transporter [Deltaproteobacteria bacterium]MBI3017374.1 cation transporter [Deltaproteobacteria bacterium]